MAKANNKIDFLNSKCLNIFTDASTENISKSESDNSKVRAVAACSARAGKYTIEQEELFLNNVSNCEAELYALLLGIKLAKKYKNKYTHIRIFSDSQYAINIVRKWIIKWVKDTEGGINVFGANGTLKNQFLILDIIYTILYNDIPLEFYHIKSHTNIKNPGGVEAFKISFAELNSTSIRLDNITAYYLILGNKEVDSLATHLLYMSLHNKAIKNTCHENLVTVGYKNIDLNKYQKLVNCCYEE